MKKQTPIITTIAACLVAGIVFANVSPAGAVPLDITITTDNAYGFGFGNASGIINYFGGIRNTAKADIYDNPPQIVGTAPASPYTIPGVGAEIYQISSASLTDYAYLVAWSDDSAYQGALAGFQLPSGPLLSGTGAWRVFATGIDRDSQFEADTLTAADLPLINSQITVANAAGGGLGTSIGWVDENGLLPDNITLGAGELAIGPPNVPNALFNFHDQVDGISGQSNWMWYNEDPSGIPNPFHHSTEGSDGHAEFLIFRTEISEVMPEPSTFVLLGIGAVGLLVFQRRKRWPMQ